jgi:hypothetical protein
VTPRRNKIIGAITSAVVSLTLLGGATGASAAGTPDQDVVQVAPPTGPTTSPTTPKPKPPTDVASPKFFKPRSR